MHKLYELREKLMEELESCTKKDGEMTPAHLDTVYKLIESIKGIDKIFMLNGEDEGEYSQRPYSARMHGNSYRRGGASMGRYSGNRWTITSGGMRYSRDNRKDQLMDCLEELKSNAPSDKALEAIDTVMAQIRLGE